MTASSYTPDSLPPIVARYFERVLVADQRPILLARMTQHGMLRTDLRHQRWKRFQGTQVVRPLATSFIWNADVRIFPLVWVQVRDAYVDGAAASRVQLMSAFTVASDSGRPELDSGALHRYLAEAIWYPTALLPSAGVVWNGLDARRATATVTHAGTTVSLEFRFNDLGEAVAIYAPQRWMRLGKGYVSRPWEGHFSTYRRIEGMLIPSRAEVGWHQNGRLELVWQGTISSLEYVFQEPAAAPRG